MTDTVRAPAPKRTRYVVAVVLCVAAIVAVVVLSVILSDNVVYFRTVSEAVKERPKDRGSRFRLMGQVVHGSIHETKDGVRFRVTDGNTTATVVHHGDPPDLFKAGAPVVCEGRWLHGSFDSDRIMIKHGSDYTPPKVTTTARPS
ncbi:MAG: cytochrome c maturation protein CcmE [Acidimicrobiia bacterium]